MTFPNDRKHIACDKCDKLIPINDYGLRVKDFNGLMESECKIHKPVMGLLL